MKIGFCKIFSVLFTGILLTGAANFAFAKGGIKAISNEPIKLDVFSMTANYAGIQSGWFAKVVKDKFNMELNIISSNLQGGDSKFATMMASGNLGDIVIFGNDDQRYTDAIKAGLLLDWTKNNLLATYGKDILKNYPKAIQKNKLNFGGGKKVYGIGHSVSNMPPTTPSEGEYMTFGPNLRWDLYEKLGKPQIKTMEDYLPVLKKMQQLEPKSDSGRPTYAFSMWADWDGNLMMNAKQFACMQGYDELGLLLVSANEDKYQDFLSPSGYYLRTLKLYYKANQMDLVDPDSISQKYDDALNKMTDGQTLFTWFPWMNTYNTPARINAGKGFKLVPFKEEKVYSYGFTEYGGSRVLAIGSHTKYPERVMQFIDWMYTPDGEMTIFNGPRGLTWEVVKGKPVLTNFGKKALPTNEVQVPKAYGGGSFRDGINEINFPALSENSINPQYKEPYNYLLWSSTLKANPSKLDLSWRKDMKALTAKDYVVKNKLIAVSPATQISTKTPDSEIQQKLGQIATIIKQDSWKMIFAKNDGEYNSLKNDMITKAKGLGYNDVVKFYITQAKRLFAARKTVK